MSELREKIEGILEAGDMFLNPPEDMAKFIEKGAIKQSRADQILTAFKAHIRECEIPGSPYFEHSDKTSIYFNAIETYRKALMESLEEKKG